MDLVLLFMQLLAAQYCPLPTHRRVEAIANRQPPRPSLGGVRQIDHVAMCGSERSLRSYTIFGLVSSCLSAQNGCNAYSKAGFSINSGGKQQFNLYYLQWTCVQVTRMALLYHEFGLSLGLM